jgi:hypothetical protein
MSRAEVGPMTSAKLRGCRAILGEVRGMRELQRTSRSPTRQSRQAGNSTPFSRRSCRNRREGVRPAPFATHHPEAGNALEGPGVPRTRKKTGQWRLGSWHCPQPCAPRCAATPTRAQCALGSEGNDLRDMQETGRVEAERTCKSGEGIRYGYLSGERLSVWERIIAPSIRPAR